MDENIDFLWPERDLIPFEISEISGDRVLVIAPHPDDETLGCGGSLIQHVERGEKVMILFLTDGSGGDFSGSFAQKDYVALREEEATEACQVLGVDTFRFLRFTDRKLGHDPNHLVRVKEEIRIFNPNLIYVPSPLEINPDHRAAASLVWQATSELELSLQIVFYEISTPLQPNKLVDITEYVEKKRLAVSCYKSQMQQINYLEIALSINKFRTLTVSRISDYAEGYLVVDRIKSMGKRLSDFFSIRKMEKLEDCVSNPLVSIIVRTKDRPKLLTEALKSIEEQHYKNLEVILVNDGGQEIRNLIEPFRRTLTIKAVDHYRSKGRSVSANTGLRMATGSYIGFLDDDDLLYPDHVESLVRFIHSNEKADFVYSDCILCRYNLNPQNSQLTKLEERAFKGIDYNQDRLYQMNFIPIMTALFSKELLQKSGLMDESLDVFEDWDLWIRMSLHTDFIHLPKITAEYRIIGDRSYDYLAGQIKIYEKYWQIFTPKKIIGWLHKTQGENDQLKAKLEKIKYRSLPKQAPSSDL